MTFEAKNNAVTGPDTAPALTCSWEKGTGPEFKLSTTASYTPSTSKVGQQDYLYEAQVGRYGNATAGGVTVSVVPKKGDTVRTEA